MLVTNNSFKLGEIQLIEIKGVIDKSINIVDDFKSNSFGNIRTRQNISIEECENTIKSLLMYIYKTL